MSSSLLDTTLAGARLPRLAASPSSAGSLCRLRPVVPPSAPLPPPPTTSGSNPGPAGPPPGRADTPIVKRAVSNRRKPPHTTHRQDFPQRVIITRPHHPFEGQSLEVLR